MFFLTASSPFMTGPPTYTGMPVPATQLGFPKRGYFCKTGFSVLGKVKISFRVWFRKSRHCIHCKLGGGLQAATLLSELLLTLSSRRSKRAFNLPPCLPGIERVTALEILGVTITL